MGKMMDWVLKRKKQKNISPQVSEEHINLSNNIDTSNHICGLYFMKTMSVVDGKEIYAVKIGRSEDIGKRMYMYRTHTPFTILGGVCEVRSNLLIGYEEICHLKLHKYALPNIYCSGEWEIVSRENYEKLCAMCDTDEKFRETVNNWVAC